MLRVACPAYLEEVLQFAEKEDCLGALEDRLAYLHRYADENLKGDCICELRFDHDPNSFYIIFLLKEKVWMVGGLNYHSYSKKWSVNT